MKGKNVQILHCGVFVPNITEHTVETVQVQVSLEEKEVEMICWTSKERL